MFSMACSGRCSRPIPSILIADSDPDTRLLYRMIIEPHAGLVLEANDGLEALRVATQTPPALVILETRLRRLDGYRLCQRLRANPLTRATRQLVVTADAYLADLTRAAQAGADRVLTKPCSPDALLEVVMALSGNAHVGRA
jgi:putative two-component system response regulator